MEERALELLHQALGPDAKFHDGQFEAVLAVARDRRRVLVVQQTGWGKSLVYFLATRLLRESGTGPTLLISPLLALMRDQIRTAESFGVRALSMNSTNRDEWPEVEAAVSENRCDLLLISPEHLASSRFVEEVLPTFPRGVGLLVVDEAHCISDWGHDFRPDYRRIARFVQGLPKSVPVLATTATANDRVVRDVEEQLGPGLTTLRGPLARSSLRIQVVRLDDQAERLAWLAENIPTLPGSGIIYCLTKEDCERVSGWLQSRGIEAPVYHAGVDQAERPVLEERLLKNEVKALVSTIALGMGFDKPDLGFVVHFQRPGSMVSYYQQIGRAGRAIKDAFAIILTGREDDTIQNFFIASAFPSLDRIREILRHIEASANGVTLAELVAKVNLSSSRIEDCLEVLTVDGAIVKEGRLYVRTVNPWEPDGNRPENVVRLRREELARMQALEGSSGCLMEFVARELDDPHASPCGRCAVCAGDFVAREPHPQTVSEALVFLRGRPVGFNHRKMWPRGAEHPYRGAIPVTERAEDGRALGVYGDPGWGALVVAGREAGEFPDELVIAAAEFIKHEWNPNPFPQWVTAVPSLGNPYLVPAFAKRLAARLGLPYRAAVTKVKQTAPQKSMRNSVQQFTNIADAFAIAPSEALGGPVLLVDDVVNSGWTVAIAGALLRRAGAGPVFPFALAKVSGAKTL